MSGTGTGGGPPTFLTPIAVDEPIGYDEEGRPIRPTMYFAQMIQRILSFLGQPITSAASGGGGSPLTIAEQLSLLQTQVTNLSGAMSPEAPGQFGRLAALEAAIRLLRFRPAPTVPRAGRAWFPAVPALAAVDGVAVSWLAGQNPNNLVLFTATTPRIVTSITGRLEIAEGAAATLTIVKAASGTALSAGTALHTGSFNANGTPATNQTLTLAALASVALAAGDSIGVRTTGTWTTSTGGLTVAVQG